jgi:septal ring factor EnvC (AmiA/AmiB activator)
VVAVAAGRVSFVGSLPGFDEVVVLDHGGGYLSLTGRLVAVGVADGQEVEAGTTLGHAAPKTVDDGLGRTIYFEIRHGRRPIDPLPFLRAP